MEPAKYPGCSGTRNLHDNLSDLKAQVAANHKVWKDLCVLQFLSNCLSGMLLNMCLHVRFLVQVSFIVVSHGGSNYPPV